MAAAPPVRLFGIRHHGPGSARSLAVALDDYQPDVVLVEGPPEAEALLAWVADPELQPPVALFAYEAAAPANSGFWPFAVFSPEWQALTWAARRGVDVRFIDLPAAITLAARREATTERSASESADSALPDSAPAVTQDPFSALAALAAIDDPERWWDEVVESTPGGDRFAAVAEMMAELRGRAAEDGPEQPAPDSDRVREAHMRQALRRARREFDRVAVVCGAWHVPALSDPLPPAGADAALLKGLAKVKCEVAWVPWTHSRLAAASGYGAGVTSPGWYHHLFTTADAPVVRWLTEVARTLRAHDLPVSSAHVIEATRLSETLAALRGRGLPGLGEVSEAVLAVMCDGSQAQLALVQREVVVGERLGSVPNGAPLVPLDADLRTTAKTLRLAFAATPKELSLDLRKDFDRRRSELLHRLGILGIDWGNPRAENSIGTFKEGWTLAWEPALAVAVVEASGWGTTIPVAATRRLVDGADDLPAVSAAIERSLIADLPDALEQLLALLDQRAAAEGDVEHLLSAIPPLARAARYGNVRGTDTSHLVRVADSVLVRACAGLAPAVAGLGEEAGAVMVRRLDAVQRAIGLLADEATATWTAALAELADRSDAPAGVVGRAVRLLFDGGRIDSEEIAGRLGRALSGGHPAAYQAAWAEGLLAGDALLLIHDESLLRVLDDWLVGMDADGFTDAIPVLRRTFGTFTRPARRQVELRVRGLAGAAGSAGTDAPQVDLEAAAEVLATVRLLLGVSGGSSGEVRQ